MKLDPMYTYILPGMGLTCLGVFFFGTVGLLGGSMFANAGFAVDPVILSRKMGLGFGGLILFVWTAISCRSYFSNRNEPKSA